MTRRLIGTGLAALACAALGGTALAAPASGGRHLPYFSLMNERVAVKRLPLDLRIWFGGGLRGSVPSSGPAKGWPVWFGEIERPKMTILAAGNGRWVCEAEVPKDEMLGGGGGCTSLGASRELFNLSVRSCGKGRPRHFRITALVPNGVTGLAIEKSDGTTGRTVPVIENTVAFTVGRENIALHGVGNGAAERLERNLPLASVGGDRRAGCSGYSFFEEGSGGWSSPASRVGWTPVTAKIVMPIAAEMTEPPRMPSLAAPTRRGSS